MLGMFLQEIAIVQFRLYDTVWDVFPKPVQAIFFFFFLKKISYSFRFPETGHLRAQLDFELNMKVLEH